MDRSPAPWPVLAAFLRATAEGRDLPPVPAGLPAGLVGILEALRQAVE